MRIFAIIVYPTGSAAVVYRFNVVIFILYEFKKRKNRAFVMRKKIRPKRLGGRLGGIHSNGNEKKNQV